SHEKASRPYQGESRASWKLLAGWRQILQRSDSVPPHSATQYWRPKSKRPIEPPPSQGFVPGEREKNGETQLPKTRKLSRREPICYAGSSTASRAMLLPYNDRGTLRIPVEWRK